MDPGIHNFTSAELIAELERRGYRVLTGGDHATRFGLTPVQRRVYDFIRGRELRGMAAPSYAQIAHHIGRKAPSGALRVVRELAQRGAVLRVEGVGGRALPRSVATVEAHAGEASS